LREAKRERDKKTHVLVVRSTTLQTSSLPDEKRCSSLELPKEEEFSVLQKNGSGNDDNGVDVNIQFAGGRKIKQTIRRAERPLQKFIQSPNPFRDGNGFVLRRRALVVRSFVR
jgi:hypothetical protein